MKQLKAEGCNLYLVSDTEATASNPSEMEKPVFKLFDKKFFSCDYGMVKCQKQYQTILNELVVLPESCMMIGDNYHKDIYEANATGIKGVLMRHHEATHWKYVFPHLKDNYNYKYVIKSWNEIINQR